MSEYKKNYYQQNKDRMKAYQKEWNAKNPERLLWITARSRAKRMGMQFNIDVNDIVIPTHCPYLHIPISSGRGKGSGGQYDTCTLDKIDPALGYVKGNVQVISYLTNAMKHNATPTQLLTFAESVLKLHGRT